MARVNLLRMFRETMQVSHAGFYEAGGSRVELRRSHEQHSMAKVFSSREMAALLSCPEWQVALAREGSCAVEVTDEDSFVAARALAELCLPSDKPPLVLNFANPHEPGGGVTRGVRAQEEDLCRRSTLYLSLTSPQAEPYYHENRAVDTSLFTDNAILSPHVEVFREADGSYLSKPYEVAVLTMAAPYCPLLTREETERLPSVFAHRITGLLHLAASHGYTRLVLGAWGCGAFGNDPVMVAEAFGTALLQFGASCNGIPSQRFGLDDTFEQVRFAVLPGPNHEVFAGVLGSLSPKDAAGAAGAKVHAG